MVKLNTVSRVLVVALFMGALQVEALRSMDEVAMLGENGDWGNGSLPNADMTTPQINQKIKEMRYHVGDCRKCAKEPPPFDASCWSKAPPSTKWKMKELYTKNNILCHCPANYDDTTKRDTLLKRAPTAEETKNLVTIKLCKKAGGGKCVEWVETKVSSFSVDYLTTMDLRSYQRGVPFFSKEWDDEFRAGVISRQLEPCYKVERYYTGNGVNDLGYGAFNALLRDAHHLGAQGFKNYNGKPGLIPQSILQTAAFLVKELQGHQPESGAGDSPLIREGYAVNWPKSTTELLYRGSYCTPFNEGDKIIVTSFLSTSLAPHGSYLTESKCVFIFRNVIAARPHSMYSGSEAEVLLPMGTCLKVVKKGSPGKMLVGNTPESQKKAGDILKKAKHKYQYLLDGIQCPTNLNSKDLKIL